ncbi:agmatine deiminase family protein [Asticcacaulis machinosus]|uniref:Agmatine deiminase family protein n=1 Tax=Asticcacaulis machinosus TaxID=2984211 RepID=A0ABT5HLI2_9CAUL|nr:agmatine deiminase family protein [Asticcacaulis machinosus]MDC7677101.1 agmatine deiminase family protein [Asticcacaulis machinosus]
MTKNVPAANGFSDDRVVPAEWEPHQAMWLGFPSHENLWQEDLIPAQAEVAALARVLAEAGDEHVKLMVMGDAARKAAEDMLGDLKKVEIIDGKFGDIWFRDTGPIYVSLDKDGKDHHAARPISFLNNGWGGKYHLKYDDQVAAQITTADGHVSELHEFILEGGSLDHDGFGTVLTTRQCLLNPNRNPDWTQSTAEQALTEALGAKKVIWLGDGLLNDHTDGHIDNLARFVAPGVVACPVAFGTDDPNAEIYDTTAKFLSQQTDARGMPLQVVRIPSPGKTLDEDGEIIPASHMNFLIANDCVVVPIYNDRPGEMAVEALQSLFPERTVLGLSSEAILTGGGSFHCISQQVPLIRA